MSRSRFSNRFSQLVGVGPMKYLTDWRMQKALVLLEEEHNTVQEIAQLSGYRSTAAFSRAFTQKFGCSPTAFRNKST
jgi:AraC-like DNA-binding protein